MTQHAVLVVDDNQDEGELIGLAFESAGHPVRLEQVTSVAEALRLLVDDGRRYALVLADWSMPREGGQELLRALGERALLTEQPVAVITGSTNPAERDRALALGAHEHYVKAERFDKAIDLARRIAERFGM